MWDVNVSTVLSLIPITPQCYPVLLPWLPTLPRLLLSTFFLEWVLDGLLLDDTKVVVRSRSPCLDIVPVTSTGPERRGQIQTPSSRPLRVVVTVRTTGYSVPTRVLNMLTYRDSTDTTFRRWTSLQKRNIVEKILMKETPAGHTPPLIERPTPRIHTPEPEIVHTELSEAIPSRTTETY